MAAYPRVKNPDTATSLASRLLRKDKVAAYISKKLKEIENHTRIERDRILKEESRIAYSDIRKLFPDGDFDDLPDDIALAVSSIEIEDKTVQDINGNPVTTRKTKFRLWDKGRALGRSESVLGMNAPIKVQDTTPKDLTPEEEEVLKQHYSNGDQR